MLGGDVRGVQIDAVSQPSWTDVSDWNRLSPAPVVSVLMLAHNHERYLAEAIEGVIAQCTDFPFELVIGEDASSDATRRIALEYQARFSHLVRVLFPSRNVGSSDNFRQILEVVRGEFVAICEGDDYWMDRNKLQVQVTGLRSALGVDIAFHSCMTRTAEEGSLRGPASVRAKGDRIVPLREVILGAGDFMPTASILIRTGVARRLARQLSADALMLDYYFQVFGAARGGALYMDKAMSVYRMGVPGSFSESMRDDEKRYAFQRKLFDGLAEVEAALGRHGEFFAAYAFAHCKSAVYRSVIRGDDRMRTVALDNLLGRGARLSPSERLWVFVAQRRAGSIALAKWSIQAARVARLARRVLNMLENLSSRK